MSFKKPNFHMGAFTVVNQSTGPIIPDMERIESYTNLVFYPNADDPFRIVAIGDVYYADDLWFAGVVVQCEIVSTEPRAPGVDPEGWADAAIHELASWVWPILWDFAATRLRSLVSVMTPSTLEISRQAPTEVAYSTHSEDR